MLSLERFAEVRAEIERTGDRDAAIADAGLDKREWIHLQRHWLRELAGEAASGGTELATRYCRAFTGASSTSSPSEQTVVAAPLAPVDVPSYLVAQAVVSPAVPEASPAPPPPPAAAPIPFTGTAMVFELPRGPATPFQPAASQEAALAAPEAGATATVEFVLAPTRPSTPFSSPEVGPFGFTLQRYVELVAACQEPDARREQVLSRFGLDAVSFADLDSAWKAKLRAEAGLTLEFHRRLTEENKLLADRRREAAERQTRLNETAEINVHNLFSNTAKSAATAAPQPAPTAHVPELTVEQYAWVVATLRKATSPVDLEQALARFRLTAETRKLLAARWRTRMAADPALQSRFVALLAGHLRGPGA